MNAPTPKDFATAQAKAALVGLELAQADGQTFKLTDSMGRTVDLTDWQQVVAYLAEVRHG